MTTKGRSREALSQAVHSDMRHRPLAEALLQTAEELHGSGLLDKAMHARIALRHASTSATAMREPITGTQIQTRREKE